jgi:uncharacterized protein
MSSLSPKSPCIGVCSLGPQGWCVGCFRTMEEITGWLKLDPDARWTVVRSALNRRQFSPPHGGTAIKP